MFSSNKWVSIWTLKQSGKRGRSNIWMFFFGRAELAHHWAAGHRRTVVHYQGGWGGFIHSHDSFYLSGPFYPLIPPPPATPSPKSLPSPDNNPSPDLAHRPGFLRYHNLESTPLCTTTLANCCFLQLSTVSLTCQVASPGSHQEVFSTQIHSIFGASSFFVMKRGYRSTTAFKPSTKVGVPAPVRNRQLQVRLEADSPVVVPLAMRCHRFWVLKSFEIVSECFVFLTNLCSCH